MADFRKKDIEGKWLPVLLVIPVAVPTFLLTQIDYTFLWRYVGWSNQVVATVMLWTASIYLLQKARFHWICSLPALFMTGVVGSYIFYAPEGFGLSYSVSMVLGAIIWVAVFSWFIGQVLKYRPERQQSLEMKSVNS